MELNATLLDPTSFQRVPSGVTWAPRIPIHLTISLNDPSMVRLQLRPNQSLARWISEQFTDRLNWGFPLELLATGVDAPGGNGDVMVTPTYRRDLIEIILNAGSKSLGLRVRRAGLVSFLEEIADQEATA